VSQGIQPAARQKEVRKNLLTRRTRARLLLIRCVDGTAIWLLEHDRPRLAALAWLAGGPL
jgi:hypothetical protein